MRKITRIVVHCTDSPDSLDVDAKTIDRWHKERGWTGIGYHWVVRRTGQVEMGRPESEVGSHVFGHNRDTIGVVWSGRSKPEPAQYEALIAKIVDCNVRFGLTADDVFGHCELANGKTCPNLHMAKVRADVRQLQESL